MRFTKMQGCGNCYIYIDCFKESVTEPGDLARRVSDIRFGIGADGLVLIEPSQNADFTMTMFNADGSQGEMCGNAIRCVAKYVYEHGMTDKKSITIETLAGIKTLELKVSDEGIVESATVDMGSPITEPYRIPLNLELLGAGALKEVIGLSLTASGREFLFTMVSMGNPHAVTFIEDVDKFPIEEYGPCFEHHKLFPNRTNTEFVELVDRSHIRMRVWERGSGETWACGTGACACAYAAMLNGYTDDQVSVQMRGGTLDIRYDRAKNTIYMTGPAVMVCDGELKTLGA